jgi:hypothetical protein
MITNSARLLLLLLLSELLDSDDAFIIVVMVVASFCGARCMMMSLMVVKIRPYVRVIHEVPQSRI